MHQIEFIYRSTSIKPSILVLYFLRLNGIYVYERFFDYGEKEELYLYENFPEISAQREKMREWISDYYFYFVGSDEDKTAFKKMYRKRPHTVVIDSTGDEKFKQMINDGSAIRYVRYDGGADRELLDEIITIIESDENEQELLRQTAEVYFIHKIWQLNVGAYTSDQFQQVRDTYKQTASALINIMAKNEINISGNTGKYLRYAVCKLGYETNMYCIRNKEVQAYTPISVAAPIREFLHAMDGDDGFADNLNLLLAQIYEDLLQEPNQAYRMYSILGEEPYNAYAVYRKAEYWKNFRQDLKAAAKYYTQSIAYFPEYYKAWLNLGVCYASMRKYGKAVDAFRKVQLILMNKRRHRVLSPVETEFLYSAYDRCGTATGYHLYNAYRAISEYTEAVSVGEEIDKSQFFDLVCDLDDKEAIKNVLKKRINTKSMYGALRSMAAKVNDEYLVKEYHKRLMEE